MANFWPSKFRIEPDWFDLTPRVRKEGQGILVAGPELRAKHGFLQDEGDEEVRKRVVELPPDRAGTAVGAVFAHPDTGIVSTWERSDLPDALVLGDKDKVRAGTVHVAPWSWIKRKESVLHVEAVH